MDESESKFFLFCFYIYQYIFLRYQYILFNVRILSSFFKLMLFFNTIIDCIPYEQDDEDNVEMIQRD